MTSLAIATSDGTARPNDTRLQEFMADVREFGRNSAVGQDALPNLAIATAKASADGVIGPYDKKTHGPNNPDDAHRIYEAYVENSSKKAVHTDGGVKNHTSELRQIIVAAVHPTDSFLPAIDTARDVHKAKRKADAKSVRPFYKTIVAMARKLKNQDGELTAEQIAECVEAPITPDKDLEKLLKPIQKALEKVITGENTHGVKAGEEYVERLSEAYHNVGTVLGEIATLVKRKELFEKAEAMGYTLAQIEQAVAEVELEAAAA